MRQVILYGPVCFLILLGILCGCSSSTSQTSPSLDHQPEKESSDKPLDTANHKLLGTWTANVNLESHSVMIEPNRDSLAHFNVQPYLPAPEIIINFFDPISQVADLDVTIKNPSKLDAYDVRLIVFTDAVGHMLMNSDAWTNLYDIPGGWPFNPFKAFAMDSHKRIFPANTESTSKLFIKFPGGNTSIKFAIDASYPGNCEEPFDLSNFKQTVLYNDINSKANVSVVVDCWNQGQITNVEFECPDITGMSAVALSSRDNQFFEGEIANTNNAAIGNYKGICKARASGSNVYIYKFVDIQVSKMPKTGWATRFDSPYIFGVEVDPSENIYAMTFPVTLAKYDIQRNQQWLRNLNTNDDFYAVNDLYYDDYFDFAYIAGDSTFCTTTTLSGLRIGKFGLTNHREWANTGCLESTSHATAATADSYGNSFFTGYYENGVGGCDSVMWKIGSTGTSYWVHDFTNDSGSMMFSNLAYSDSYETFYAVGSFWGTQVDFDPSAGTLLKTPRGFHDAFLSEWDVLGGYEKIRSWGDSAGRKADTECVSVEVDSLKNIFVTGSFTEQVDFDPSGGVYNVLSNGLRDAYIIKFDSSMNFKRMIRIGGSGDDFSTSLAIGPDNSVYLTGGFEQSVDFDPNTSRTEQRISNGDTDIYLAKYNNNLDLDWVQIFGSNLQDMGLDVAVTKNSNIILAGIFQGKVDFDPSPDKYELAACSDSDTFMMRLLPNGFWE